MLRAYAVLVRRTPSSHTHERRRAKESAELESAEEEPRNWACLDICNFFITTLSERSEILLTEKREKRENR